MFELLDLLVLALIGLFAGFVGGMLGVGGSIVLIPALTEARGPDQHLYQAAAMIVNFFVVVPAVIQHRRARSIDGSTVVRLVPPAIVAVIIGVGISELSVFEGAGEPYLRGFFGLFLFCVAGYDIYRLYRHRASDREGPGEMDLDSSPPGMHRWWSPLAVAIPTGLVAGLLGIGGGLLAVPLQRRVLHIPIRTAIANSATIIIAISLVGALVKNYAYVVDHGYSLRSLALAGVLIPTAIVGSLCGSKITYRLPLRLLKTAFFLLLAVAAVRLTHGAVRVLEQQTAETPANAQLLRNPHQPRCGIEFDPSTRLILLT